MKRINGELPKCNICGTSMLLYRFSEVEGFVYYICYKCNRIDSKKMKKVE